MPTASRLLAFDTSTEHLSVAVQNGEQLLAHSGAGGAQASTTLIPAVLALLAEAAALPAAAVAEPAALVAWVVASVTRIWPVLA